MKVTGKQKIERKILRENLKNESDKMLIKFWHKQLKKQIKNEFDFISTLYTKNMRTVRVNFI